VDSRTVIVLTTFGTDVDAARVARTLVDERLAACVNLLPPMTSIYRWKGKIETEHELQVLMKTSADRVPALEQRLREIHPYEVPEFLVLSIETGSEAYLSWVAESTKPVA
jgi:periplasmic divalent cation tolerance protein